eukprot:CAMPEP_0195511032 /NCGR_PEP_ID=MMETSP0794_2-20130614/3494_1 /TAXON_ID=515487 /ORGANISM="Stephanopyxis turris, Strain CCMP 815" /LENGTH=587 /DNA_ID=CAMNT_0040638565 /DNA_START=31 /DNA_END=1794 /DNA_ORIENTATION=+
METKSAGSSFTLPKVTDNTGAWGPLEDSFPEEFEGLESIFTHFDKNEYLRPNVADFTRSWHRTNKHKNGEENENLAFKHDDEEDNGFMVVDNVKSARQKQMARRTPGRRRHNNRTMNLMANKDGDLKKIKRRPVKTRYERRREKMRNRGIHRHDRHEITTRQASIEPETTWEVVEQFELKNLEKMRLTKKVVDKEGKPVLNKDGSQKETVATSAPAGVDLEDGWMGYLDYYDNRYERVDTKHFKKLNLTDRNFYYVTTSEDDFLQHCAQHGIGNVIGTDALIAHLMVCQRSNYPWDIIVKKVGKTVLFDKRHDSEIDYVTVNETSYRKPDPEDPVEINRPSELSEEATRINQNFSQQVLLPFDGTEKTAKNRKHYPRGNPFTPDDSDDDSDDDEEEGDPASIAYRYRMWKVDEDITLVARCELHGLQKLSGKPDRLMTTYALNEYQPSKGSSNWRRILDSQRGAVFATEIKNNVNKLWKWTAQSLLAGADTMKLGFVSRRKADSAESHVILGTQFYQPSHLANQINMNLSNIWGVLQTLVRTVRAQPDGKFVIHKHPNKPILTVYKVPQDTFSDSDSDSDSSDDDEE